MLMLPKLAYRFNVIAVKIPVVIFIVFDTLMLKVMWEKKELGIASVFLKNESWTRKFVLSDMKLLQFKPVRQCSVGTRIDKSL